LGRFEPFDGHIPVWTVELFATEPDFLHVGQFPGPGYHALDPCVSVAKAVRNAKWGLVPNCCVGLGNLGSEVVEGKEQHCGPHLFAETPALNDLPRQTPKIYGACGPLFRRPNAGVYQRWSSWFHNSGSVPWGQVADDIVDSHETAVLVEANDFIPASQESELGFGKGAGSFPQCAKHRFSYATAARIRSRNDSTYAGNQNLSRADLDEASGWACVTYQPGPIVDESVEFQRRISIASPWLPGTPFLQVFPVKKPSHILAMVGSELGLPHQVYVGHSTTLVTLDKRWGKQGIPVPRRIVKMSRVVFMCGPAGAGKSTIARQLESAGMKRLSFDEEAWQMGLRTMPLPAEAQREIEAALQARLVALVESGQDVVLGFSFWSLSMREEYRRLLRPLGIEPEVIYLATPREVVLARLRDRAARHPDDFALSEELAAQYFDQFEVPTDEEGLLTVVSVS
jgi:predicted kinase